jgi:hypothetical protein
MRLCQWKPYRPWCGHGVQRCRIIINAENSVTAVIFRELSQERAAATAYFQQWAVAERAAFQNGVTDGTHAYTPPMV